MKKGSSIHKLFRVSISNHLKWNHHVDYIFKKASKFLFSLQILVKAGVASRLILKLHLTNLKGLRYNYLLFSRMFVWYVALSAVLWFVADFCLSKLLLYIFKQLNSENVQILLSL